ncbi:flagellar biosynthetic protein FliO [Marinomonas sp. A79]|uniref:Flagellar protein n=2 Tax=Marinomonas vulgaris TaxID=2823372 RepID=A0ABS5HAP5_9GAMM|nr:flagellar biosynthetic protein FliO [Marinomonas vulgaris]
MAATSVYAIGSQAPDAQGVSLASSIWKVIASLVFIIAFIPACLWVMKRFQLTQMKLGQSAIKVVHVQSLGAKEKLMLVEVEGERLLIGVTAQTITHLKSLPNKSASFADVMDDVGRDQNLNRASDQPSPVKDVK